MGRALVAVIAFMALAAVPAHATEPAALYNAPGQSHARVCVSLTGASAPLRFGNADPTGFSVTNAFSFDSGECAAGTVRLDLHEVIPTEAGNLVFHRGGNGYADDQNVKYGELLTSDIASALPAPVPPGGGRGSRCESVGDAVYDVQVRSIEDEMHYKRPQDVPNGSNRGASFMHYGDPGADQGDRDNIHYSYLLWSFLNVRGGGMVRTLLRPGQDLRLCDVEPLTMDAWDRDGNVNGSVTARYVRVLAGNCPLYGWMVWTHRYLDGAPVEHAVAASTPPPAEPPLGQGCPGAPPAQPPQVTTGPAQPGASGAWTLTGTVNTMGVPTTYRFDYGTDASYGLGTADTALAADSQPDPVAASVTGLQPGATYHYRLVATSAIGTSYGPDATFATPPPPPVVRAAAKRVTLSRLRLTPKRFRRARTRRGTTSRIRFTLSARAKVTLTFERHVKRGHRWRWVKVRGSLVRTANGSQNVRFGGWLGTRPLARGGYRLTAVPRGADGRRGSARRAAFRLR